MSSSSSPVSDDGDRHTRCPLCSRKTWAQQEQDLWRLERWLDFAETQLRSHDSVPTNMEQLEDTVQDYRVRWPLPRRLLPERASLTVRHFLNIGTLPRPGQS